MADLVKLATNRSTGPEVFLDVDNGSIIAGAAVINPGDGNMNGPASSVDGHIPQYNGTSGKLLKDGLALSTDGALGTSDTTLSSQKAVKTYADGVVQASRAETDEVASGAIPIANGVYTLGSAGALSETLGTPSAGQKGVEITVIAITAHAHTITTASGKLQTFGGTSGHIITFAAVGDFVRLLAVNGVWQIIALGGAVLS